jgi:hypothetical protein
MSKEFDEMVAHLKWLNFWIRHSCDQAEAKMAEVNRLLQQLAETGWVQETVILGAVIHQRYYAPLSGGHDSSQVVQAALCLPGGLGVVLWDSEDYTSLKGRLEIGLPMTSGLCVCCRHESTEAIPQRSHGPSVG